MWIVEFRLSTEPAEIHPLNLTIFWAYALKKERRWERPIGNLFSLPNLQNLIKFKTFVVLIKGSLFLGRVMKLF